MIVDIERPVPSDIEIAQAARMRPIIDVAQQVGLSEDDLDLYGKYKAKVHLDVLERLADRPNAKAAVTARSCPWRTLTST
jgi:formate--tetrahydrofolate ligase